MLPPPVPWVSKAVASKVEATGTYADKISANRMRVIIEKGRGEIGQAAEWPTKPR